VNREVQHIPFFASSNNKGKISATKSSRTPPNSKPNRYRKKNQRFRKGLLGFLVPKKSQAKKPTWRRKPATTSSLVHPIVGNSSFVEQPNKPRVKNSSSPKEPRFLSILPPPLAIATRLIVLTVGVSTIIGSTLSIAHSVKTVAPAEEAIAFETVITQEQQDQEIENLFSIISLGKEISGL